MRLVSSEQENPFGETEVRGEACDLEGNVIEINFGHESNVLFCWKCDSPQMWLRLDGSITCGNPDCQEPKAEHWFIPAPVAVA